MWQVLRKKAEMPTADRALPGRKSPAFAVPIEHFVNRNRIQPPFPAGLEQAMFGLGCFWGAERMFWKIPGVYSTAVGYAAGLTPNPTYEEVCSGYTGHNEVVMVWFDPRKTSYETLLKVFWEGHDPTQGMRQGNDVGTQYRSGIYAFSADQKQKADASKALFQRASQTIPGGAGSSARTVKFGWSPYPPFMRQGTGSRLTDVDLKNGLTEE